MNNIKESFANKILEAENFILSDSGALASTKLSITDKLFNIKTFGALNKEILEIALADNILAKSWFSKDNVFTTPKVYDELTRYSTILNDKYGFLINKKNIITSAGYKYSKNYHYKKKFINRNPKYSNLEKIKKQIFSDLAFSGEILSHKVKKKVLPNKTRINNYVSIVENLEDALSIKRNNNKAHIDKFSKKDDWKTDEELVGYALYKSQFLNEQVGLVSSDFDIYWLIVGASLVLPEFNKTKLNVYVLSNDKLITLSEPLDYEIAQDKFVNLHGISAVKRTSDNLMNLIRLASSYDPISYEHRRN